MLTEKERTKTVTAHDIEHFLNQMYAKLLDKLDERVNNYDRSLDSEISKLKGGVIAIEDLYHELFLEGDT